MTLKGLMGRVWVLRRTRGQEGLEDAGVAEWRADRRYVAGSVRESLSGGADSRQSLMEKEWDKRRPRDPTRCREEVKVQTGG